jgi:quercetin dioxygenase-like cupin family protein
MHKAGKIWGETSELFRCNNVIVSRIKVKKGGCCSRHRHVSKHNYFFVEHGQLSVKVWKKYRLIDETILGPGDSCTVCPGEFHNFAALTDTEALEIYWVEISSEDIDRLDHGRLAK